MKLKELFATEDRWTKWVMARDKEGNTVDAVSEDATCWCLFGGIVRCYPDLQEQRSVVEQVSSVLRLRYGSIGMVVANDLYLDFPTLKSVLVELDL
jgi:hypothetical protein